MQYLFKDPTVTKWTNTTLCGVPGVLTYGPKIPILNDCAIKNLGDYLNSISSNIPFSFDHAVGVIPPT